MIHSSVKSNHQFLRFIPRLLVIFPIYSLIYLYYLIKDILNLNLAQVSFYLQVIFENNILKDKFSLKINLKITKFR